MNTQLNDNIHKKSRDLTIFLNSNDEGVFYAGHASILVRLNKKKLAKKNKKIKIIYISENKLRAICKKIKKNKNKVDHNIVVSHESKPDTKIIINLMNDAVIQAKQTKIPEKCHYFIVEDNEFNLWLNNKITFEEVLGTRRFRYNRNPNIYRVEINQIYTNFL